MDPDIPDPILDEAAQLDADPQAKAAAGKAAAKAVAKAAKAAAKAAAIAVKAAAKAAVAKEKAAAKAALLGKGKGKGGKAVRRLTVNLLSFGGKKLQ